MFSYLTRPAFFISALLIVAIGGLVFVAVKDDGPQYDTAIAERKDLIQEVSIIGRVVAAQHVDLAFEKIGRVAWVGVDVGDRVSKNQALVRLENGDVVALMNQAEANLKIQKATLSDLVKGSSEEEINVQKVKVANAEVSIQEAKQNLVDNIQDAFTKSDDAIRNKVDQFISNPNGTSPQMDFTISSSQLKNDIEQERVNIKSILSLWQSSLLNLSTVSVLDLYTTETKTNLNSIKGFLDDVSLAVNTVLPSSTLTQTTIDGYKSDVSIARTNINIAISNLSTAEEKLTTAESALSLAKQELILLESGATPEKIAAQEAKVEEADASVDNHRAQVAKTTIHAPISGIVTEQEAKVGEIVAANSNIVSLISTSQFEIETNIPEADIAEVVVGNTAFVTLDAYSDDDIFNAIVVSINPAETIIEGVATYKATLQFEEKDERIKSGMTANIDIITASKEAVIVVPTRAIISQNKNKIVRVLENGIMRSIVVETGIRSSEGTTEIVSGIKEGDEIIVLIRE
ncbi:efflux RND transporter periplasmic adaptor subunit [Patescibacteria group bacterium]|nr:efflux RND transporter periplasmic adaptor subunit [Patescibacteria group bacterium]